MTLKDRIQMLRTPEEVDSFLSTNPKAVIFKAGACHKTEEGLAQAKLHLDTRDDLPVGVIRVIEARAASNHVATLTGIRHESPQLLLFKDGKVVFDRDNWDITSDAVGQGLRLHLPPA